MDIYEKNISALKKVNPELAGKLSLVTTNEKYEVFQGKTFKDINILDTVQNKLLYSSPKDSLIKEKKVFEKYKEYDFLYIFGIGNGFLLEYLLKNKTHQKIVLIEPEVELIYIAFSLIDFSKSLADGRLSVILAEQLNFSIGITIFNYKNSKFYAKIFSLLVTLPYYEDFYQKEIIESNKILINALEQVIIFAGNDITDSLTGVRHHFINFPEMLKSPPYKELLAKRNSDLAIIVSTGPSLYKQLPLLQKIQKSVTIICVDASLPVLEKHSIKPDVVCSIERVALTAEFFKNTSKEFQKELIFLCVSLQHKEVLTSIHGTKVLVMRPFRHNQYFGFDDYGYEGSGLSSANLAHEFALKMGFETIVFIGQDLSYGKDGASHSKGHVFGANELKEGDSVKLPGYGGEGEVNSTLVWSIFRKSIQQLIEVSHSYCTTIDATEGGCQIEGAKEISFESVVNELVDKEFKKIPIKLSNHKKDYEKNLKKLKEKTSVLLKSGKRLQKEIEKSFLVLQRDCEALENKTLEEALTLWDDKKIIKLLDIVSKIRSKIEENNEFTLFFSEISQSNILHKELKLARIKSTYVSNPRNNKIKALQWILEHRHWLFELAGSIDNTRNIIIEAKKQWKL